MRLAALLFASLCAIAAQACGSVAEDYTFTLTNMAGDTIASVIAIDKDGTQAALSVLAEPLAPTQHAILTLSTANGECVYDLTFTFANSTQTFRPDTDICQTDTILVE